MKHLSLLFIAVLAIVSCSKKKDHYNVSGDYVIVGKAGGFTVANAITSYYLVSGTELREDKNVKSGAPPTDVKDFNFSTVRSASEFTAVKNLRSQIPSELLTRNNEYIGVMLPDAGYTDVRASVNGVAYRWKFEADQGASSDAIRRFLDSTSVLFR